MKHADPGEQPDPSEKLRSFYDQDYAARFALQPQEARLERLLPLMPLKTSDLVLDLACGSALLLPHIAPQVKLYVGVDFSDELINDARQRQAVFGIENAELHVGDIAQFCGSTSARFDVACAMDVSEHVYDRQWLSILRAIRSALKPQGTLFLHTPNAGYIIEWLKDRGLLRQLPEHVAVRGAKENSRLLEQAGFRHIKVEYLAHYERRQAWLHELHRFPVIGRWLRARLFIRCEA